MKFIVRLVYFWLILLLLALPWWIHMKFGNVDWDQLMFHLEMLGNTVVGADSSLVGSFLKFIIASFLLAILLSKAGRIPTWLKPRWLIWQRAWLFFHRIKKIRVFQVLVLLMASVYSFSALGAFSRDWVLPSALRFGVNYSDPRLADIKLNGDGKNLVLVYVESLESSYRNYKLFGRNLLASLDDLKPLPGGSRISFEHMYQSPNTSWTIAGMVSTQCGLPLMPAFLSGRNFEHLKVRSFLPHAYCLGDVLKANGYRSVFLHGSDSQFAGVGVFMEDHGYSEVKGKEYWARHGYSGSEVKGWGVHDADLYLEGQREFDELAASGKPFNLTMLTVDMHGPDGFLNPACKAGGYQNFTGVVQCTVDKLSELLTHIQQSKVGKNTVIVVMGDHLAMQNPVYQQLTSLKDRFVYNLMLLPEKRLTNTERLSRFDMFPTMLDALDFQMKHQRIGLGADAFAASSLNDKSWQQSLEKITRDNDNQKYLDMWRS